MQLLDPSVKVAYNTALTKYPNLIVTNEHCSFGNIHVIDFTNQLQAPCKVRRAFIHTSDCIDTLTKLVTDSSYYTNLKAQYDPII